MVLESTFSKGKCLEAAIQLHPEDVGLTDVEYVNSCFALPTDAILCANGAQSYTHSCATENQLSLASQIWSSVLQNWVALCCFHSSSWILCRTLKKERKNKREGKRKSTCRLEYKETLPLGSGVLVQC